MDDLLITDDGDGYLGTAEERIPRAVMYDLAGRPLSDADKDFGWPVGTAVALRHRYRERWQREFNLLCDRAVGHFQQSRLKILERITASCPKAVEIVTAAMEGKTWEGKPVTKDQRLAAENLLKTFRDFMRDDVTPAALAAEEDDEETGDMLEHAARFGLSSSAAEEAN